MVSPVQLKAEEIIQTCSAWSEDLLIGERKELIRGFSDKEVCTTFNIADLNFLSHICDTPTNSFVADVTLV